MGVEGLSAQMRMHLLVIVEGLERQEFQNSSAKVFYLLDLESYHNLCRAYLAATLFIQYRLQYIKNKNKDKEPGSILVISFGRTRRRVPETICEPAPGWIQLF